MELFITISPSDPDPMYRQITNQIKDAIAAGNLLPGDQLPSIREMSELLKISAITIKRAYQDLESEGFIFTRAGLGSFITDQDKVMIRKRKLAEIREDIRVIVETARRYGIDPVEIHRIVKEEI